MKIAEIDAEISALLKAFEKTQERVTEAGSDPAVLSDMAGLIEQRITDLVKAREKILAEIEQLPDPVYRRVLILREVAGMKWREIASEMHFSSRYVQKVYRNAYGQIFTT